MKLGTGFGYISCKKSAITSQQQQFIRLIIIRNDWSNHTQMDDDHQSCFIISHTQIHALNVWKLMSLTLWSSTNHPALVSVDIHWDVPKHPVLLCGDESSPVSVDQLGTTEGTIERMVHQAEGNCSSTRSGTNLMGTSTKSWWLRGILLILRIYHGDTIGWKCNSLTKNSGGDNDNPCFDIEHSSREWNHWGWMWFPKWSPPTLSSNVSFLVGHCPAGQVHLTNHPKQT